MAVLPYLLQLRADEVNARLAKAATSEELALAKAEQSDLAGEIMAHHDRAHRHASFKKALGKPQKMFGGL